MSTKAVQRFTAWSWSRLQDYETCPLKAKIAHLLKIKEPKGPALQHGIDTHKKAEQYVSGVLKKLPPELQSFSDEFKALRKINKRVALEQEWSFTADWKLCEWMAPDVWLRMKLDANYTEGDKLIIYDYKTGREHPESVAQLDLYAVAGFVRNVDVQVVDAAFWYVDSGVPVVRSYTLQDASALQRVWKKRTAKMLADTTFKPTPGRACGYCFYGQAGKKKGGPNLCKF